MSSIFYININNHQNVSSPSHNHFQNSSEKNYRKVNNLIIDPESVVIHFEPEKTNVEKLILQNNFHQRVNFKIIQPHKNILNVKSKKLTLNPKETCEIFLFFNGYKEKTVIEDQFVISLEKQQFQLHVPIICRPKALRMPSRKLSLYKRVNVRQNQNGLKQKPKERSLVFKKKTIAQMDLPNELSSIMNGFMQRFNQIHEFVKQKSVKKEIFIGEKALSLEKQNQITDFNQRMKEQIEKKIKNKVESRLEVQYSDDGPITRSFEGVILQWNKQKNIPRMVYEKGLGKVQEEVRKYLVNLRFLKIHRIFSLYREFENSNQHNNLPIHKKHEIYLERLEKKLNKRSEINLEFNFDKNCLIASNLQIQNDVHFGSKKVFFKINPRIGFDNWVPLEESPPYTHEIMNYSKKLPLPDWLCHPKLQDFHLKSPSDSQVRANYAKSMISGYQESLGHGISNDKLGCFNLNQRDQNLSELNFIQTLLKLEAIDHEITKIEEVAGSKTVLPSKQTIKVNSVTYSQSHTLPTNLSTRKISELPLKLHSNLQNSQKLGNQNQKIQERLQDLLNNQVKQKVFYPYMSGLESEHDHSQDISYKQFIIRDLKKQRYYLDCLNPINYPKHHFQTSLQLSPVYIVDSILSTRSLLIRKVPKQDKFLFDRLDDRVLKILEMTQKNQRQQDLKNYKLKGQIYLEPNQNQIKTFNSQTLLQKNIQNLNILKKDLLGKSHSLSTYFHQSTQNKSISHLIL